MGSIEQVEAELAIPWEKSYTASAPVDNKADPPGCIRAQPSYASHMYKNIDLARAFPLTEIQTLTAACVASSQPALEALNTVYQLDKCQVLSRGSYAVTYKVPWKEVKKLSGNERVAVGSMFECKPHKAPKENDTVVLMKVAKLTSPYKLHASLREVIVHHDVCCKAAPATAWLPKIEGSQLVPQFYRGFVVTPVRGCPLYVVAMEFLEGETLHRRKELVPEVSARLFANVEKAVKSLWCLGYRHCDLHTNNIMVQLGDRVKLIDLSQAVRIEHNTLIQMRNVITPWTDVSALYVENYLGAQAYNRIMISERYKIPGGTYLFYPDATCLLTLRKRVVRNPHAADIYIERTQAWWPQADIRMLLEFLQQPLMRLDEAAWRKLLRGN